MAVYDVLLTDADLRLTLVVLRSLGRKGIETAVGSQYKKALSFFSKYCKNRFLYPSPIENNTQFLAVIKKFLKRKKINVFFPIGEWAIIPISKHRDEIIPYTKLPLPRHETLEKTLDKAISLRIANENGIPTPKTFFPKNLKILNDISKKITYPAVIKPKWSWVWHEAKAQFRRPSYVNSARELISVYKTIHNVFPFPMIQEYVPGVNYSVAALYCNSRLKAICGIKVYRAMPVTGGNSVYRESVELDPKMKEYALRLLKALDWYGIAEIEFRLDSRDSTPKLMEINGRFWGSLEVAVESGVDFPYLLYRLVVDGDVQPVLNYKKGVKCRWFGGDVKHLLSILKGVPAGQITHTSRLRALAKFLKFYEKDMRYDSLYRDDPMPFFSPFFTQASELFVDKLKNTLPSPLFPWLI